MAQSTDLSAEFLAATLEAGRRIREGRGEEARLSLERSVPFLCLACGEAAGPLITSEAAYLIASPSLEPKALRAIAQPVLEGLRARQEVVLLLEVWIGPAEPRQDGIPPPSFRVVPGARPPREESVQDFAKRLGRVRLRKRAASVEVATPRALLFDAAALERMGVVSLGLEVGEFFVDERGRVAPLLLANLRRQLSKALRWLFWDVTQAQEGGVNLGHAMAPRRLSRAAREVDAVLAEVASQLTFVLSATPTNLSSARSAWLQRGEELPFVYRPLRIDPLELKRKLFSAPLDRVEDPTLHAILRAVQLELDRKLTMLVDRGNRRYLWGSLQVYGAVEADELREARRLLKEISPRARGPAMGPAVSGAEVAERGRAEIRYYAAQDPRFTAEVELREDVAAGLMCSQGNLLVDASGTIPANRVEALLHHEVGTHLVTYYNGQAQPLLTLARGLPGSVALQEGLAVLAEFLAGGLYAPRLRVLAARVVAVHSLSQGASLGDTIRLLRDTHELEPRVAFDVAARVHRGNGLTKDAVYFRGLRQLLRYLAEGGELEPLYVGKIALEHLSVVIELLERGILQRPLFLPRFLSDPQSAKRLAWLRSGVGVTDLLRSAPCD